MAAQDTSGVAFWSVWQDDEDWRLSSWNKNGIQIEDCLLPPSGGPWKIDRSKAAGVALVIGAATRFRCVDYMSEHVSHGSGSGSSIKCEKTVKEAGKRAPKVSSVPKMGGSMLPKSLALPPPPKNPATTAPLNVRVANPKRFLAERLRKQGMVWLGV